MKDVTVVISQYGYPQLLQDVLESFRQFYPDITIYIDDNAKTSHGVKLDKAFKKLRNPYILTMDNDIRLHTAGVIEKMLDLMKHKVYGVGELVGHEATFIHPKLALWDREAVVDKNLTFQDVMIYHPECDKLFEIQTAAFLGYQMQFKYGYRGEHLDIFSYAHHLSEKK